MALLLKLPRNHIFKFDLCMTTKQTNAAVTLNAANAETIANTCHTCSKVGGFFAFAEVNVRWSCGYFERNGSEERLHGAFDTGQRAWLLNTG